MNDKYLPMGTVVILKNGSKKLMIFGRKQMDTATQKEYDYISYLYPEGNIKKDLAILFNHEDIDTIVHLGFIDEDEEYFQEKILKTGKVADENDVFHRQN